MDTTGATTPTTRLLARGMTMDTIHTTGAIKDTTGATIHTTEATIHTTGLQMQIQLRMEAGVAIRMQTQLQTEAVEAIQMQTQLRTGAIKDTTGAIKDTTGLQMQMQLRMVVRTISGLIFLHLANEKLIKC